MFMFGTAYASNLGGTATITGTGPNLVFQSVIKQVDITQDGKYLGMTFANWMALNVPATLINVAITYVYLVVRFYGVPNFREWPLLSRFFTSTKSKEQADREAAQEKRIKDADALLKREYEGLGSMNWHEGAVLFVFCCVVGLWIFREPKFMEGWNDVISDVDIGDATAAILGIVVMFLVPKNFTFITGGKGRFEKL